MAVRTGHAVGQISADIGRIVHFVTQAPKLACVSTIGCLFIKKKS